MNRRNIRILSGVMALAIFASATNVFATTTAEYDEQISEIKAQQEANEAEAAELNATLDALRAKTADAEEYQATLEKKIENYQQSIDLTREHVDELNGSIKELLTAANSLPIYDMTITEPQLEEIFMHYYEKGGKE